MSGDISGLGGGSRGGLETSRTHHYAYIYLPDIRNFGQHYPLVWVAVVVASTRTFPYRTLKIHAPRSAINIYDVSLD